jgi:hypothetical protein
MPTVAPKIPRDMLVGSAGAPVLVFSLGVDQLRMLESVKTKTHHPAHASMSIPYEHKTRFGML